jgi:hypothetical protein
MAAAIRVISHSRQQRTLRSHIPFYGALAATLLLSPRMSNGRLRLEPHPCQQQKLESKAIDALKASFAKLSGALSQATQDGEPPATLLTVVSGAEPIALYQTLKGLPFMRS